MDTTAPLQENMISCEELSIKLADKIEAHCIDTGEQFDKIVVIPRGSFFVANIVARRLGFSAVDILSAAIGSYDDTTQNKTGNFNVGQMPTRKEVEGLRLLAIDEVSDTDETLAFLIKHSYALGCRSVKTAVLYYKPENNLTGSVPDFYCEKTNAWINYPWEIHDQIGKTSVAKRQTSVT